MNKNFLKNLKNERDFVKNKKTNLKRFLESDDSHKIPEEDKYILRNLLWNCWNYLDSIEATILYFEEFKKKWEGK